MPLRIAGNLKTSIGGINKGEFAFIDVDPKTGLVTITTATKTITTKVK